MNAMDDVGYTALHLCAERGYHDLMKILIEHGARVKFTQLGPDDIVCIYSQQDSETSDLISRSMLTLHLGAW